MSGGAAAALVRPMREADLDAADRVVRLAFGTEFRLPDPMQFLGDGDLIRPRWRANPSGCLVAESGGGIVGSVTVLDWGSVAMLGPLSVHPDYWNQGVARLLLSAALQAAEAGGARLVQLFTHPNSPRHIRLYESGGFATQNLIAIMSKPVALQPAAGFSVFSELPPDAQAAALQACRAMTGAVFDGLDLSVEIEAVRDQRLGDTVLLQRGGVVAGFAICHTGAGSDAGSAALGVKFGLASGEDEFLALLQSAEALAAQRRVARVQISVNHARRRAYDMIKARGYRCTLSGVAMRRPAADGYDTSDMLLVEEWR